MEKETGPNILSYEAKTKKRPPKIPMFVWIGGGFMFACFILVVACIVLQIFGVLPEGPSESIVKVGVALFFSSCAILAVSLLKYGIDKFRGRH